MASEPNFDYLVNEMIPAAEVRVLDKMKAMIGVMSLAEAIELATESEDDVILINPTAEPPLVRIVSISKFKYEQDKVKKDALKKQREARQDLKELKLSPRTDIHDLEVRMKKAHKELSKGNKVKLVVQFKGREMQGMQAIAQEQLETIIEHVAEVANVESAPRLQGRQMIAVLVPEK